MVRWFLLSLLLSFGAVAPEAFAEPSDGLADPALPGKGASPDLYSQWNEQLSKPPFPAASAATAPQATAVSREKAREETSVPRWLVPVLALGAVVALSLAWYRRRRSSPLPSSAPSSAPSSVLPSVPLSAPGSVSGSVSGSVPVLAPSPLVPLERLQAKDAEQRWAQAASRRLLPPSDTHLPADESATKEKALEEVPLEIPSGRDSQEMLDALLGGVKGRKRLSRRSDEL